MGFLKKLLGGDKKESAPPAAKPKPASPPPARPPEPPQPGTSEAAAASTAGTAETDDPRQLIRLLAARDQATREAAAAKLADNSERSAVRPLMNAYLNYGDPGVLKALTTYGSTLTPSAMRESMDYGVLGERRARLMDVLAATGDEEALSAVRDYIDDQDLDIHIRACVALAKLGDVFGVDKLADDLRLTDPVRRTKAQRGLLELGTPRAMIVVEEHVRRYLAEAGAVADPIEVSAPLLDQPDLNLVTYVCEHIKRSPHTLTVVIGSMAIQMASNKRDAVKEHLAGWDLHFSTPLMPPEEQIAALIASRDAAAADNDARAVFFGMLPAPHDNPPLPHFLTRPQSVGQPYTVKVIAVDPHEYGLLQDWWHYIDDKAEVPTDMEVVLAISRPERSAISEEEREIYTLTPPERKAEFPRAYLAHT